MSISKLHSNVLGIIGSYANAQELGRMACTNKRLRDAVYHKVHRVLLQAYAQEPALKSYVASVQLEKTPLTAFFQRIIQDVKATDGGKELLACFEWPAVCLQSTPVILAQRMIAEQKVRGLLVLFGKVAEQIPAAQSFLNFFVKDGSAAKQASVIRNWLGLNEALLNTITEIDLSYCNLTILPDEIVLFTQVHALDLSGNQLQTLPAELGDLTQLQKLALDNNPIQFVPKELKTSSIAAIRDNREIQAAQELQEPIPIPTAVDLPAPPAPPAEKLVLPEPMPPSPCQQIADAFYSCFSSVASFACWVWTRLMAALSEVR